MSTRAISIFKDPNVAKHLSRLHDKYIVVPVDKAPNNIVFVCKSHYRLLDKGIKYQQFTWQPYIYIYTQMTLSNQEILDNHRSVLCSFRISTKDEELDLPSL
jgi:hypothetical protein